MEAGHLREEPLTLMLHLGLRSPEKPTMEPDLPAVSMAIH